MKILKRIGIFVGGLIGFIVILLAVLYFVGRSRLANAPEVATSPVTVPMDAETLALGERLAHSVLPCVGCHGENFAGEVFMDEAPIGYVPAPNLTAGTGGVGGTYMDEDWERAIRHGVGANGRILTFMPSNSFANMSDEDLGALIAYLKSVPPVDSDLGEREIMFPGTIIFGVLDYGSLPIAKIDHENVGSVKPAEGVTAEYGEYLLNIAACRECHAENLAGNVDPNGPPLGPNLTPGGELQGWMEEDFLRIFREGVKPTGTAVKDEMPWRDFGHMDDEELQAIWLYLQSIEALPTNQ